MACCPAIASMSLGRAWAGHSLQSKLSAAAAAGFKGIEVFYEDLEHLASSLPGGTSDPENVLAAASEFKKIADEQNLTIIALQPFMHYEGLTDEAERAARQQKLQLWFRLVKILDVDIIQVPSNFLFVDVTGDRAQIVSEFQRLADAGLAQDPPVRFAYEALCWGTFVRTWKQAWEIILAVDRPNFGLCLDTFHITGGEWADPAADDGTVGKDADTRLRDSLSEMVRTVDVRKVFYVQTADAERADPPMNTSHPMWVDGQAPRLTWSRNMRLFAFEQGGYMPVREVLDKVLTPPPLGLGYHGWVSMEFFSRTLAEKGSHVPKAHAERGISSWEKIKSTFNLGIP